MPEAGKSPPTNTGDFPSSLENANNAFSTFPLPDYCCYSLSSESKNKTNTNCNTKTKTRKEHSSAISPGPSGSSFN
jgi:hypothetical protein